MHPMLVASSLLGGIAVVNAATSTASIGYDNYPTPIPSTVTGKNLTFGQHYAVLNLDLVDLTVSGVANTPAGQAFIKHTATWINKVHAQNPPPPSIFTRIYYTNSHKPELGPDTPFAAVGGAIGTSNDSITQIYPAFKVDDTAGDVVLQKSRYYAGAGNGLEEILRAQKIDTVVISGIRTSGVVLSTVYRLFDLDYKIYVIANNTIEPSDAPGINAAALMGIIPKLPANVITIEQAIAALGRSGPAIY